VTEKRNKDQGHPPSYQTRPQTVVSFAVRGGGGLSHHMLLNAWAQDLKFRPPLHGDKTEADLHEQIEPKTVVVFFYDVINIQTKSEFLALFRKQVFFLFYRAAV